MVPLSTTKRISVLNADQKRSFSTGYPDNGEKVDYVLEIVAENLGDPIVVITDLAADRNTTEADVMDLITEAVSNGELVEFDRRYWVMRKGKYRYHRCDHPET